MQPAFYRCVLDTSVSIKWYRQGEILAEQALSLRDQYLDGQISIHLPPLAAYELSNVLPDKRDLTTCQVQDMVQSLYDFNMEWHMPSAVEMQRGVEIAHSLDVTIYDAVFASLAESLDAIFVTADQRLAEHMTSLKYVYFLGALE